MSEDDIEKNAFTEYPSIEGSQQRQTSSSSSNDTAPRNSQLGGGSANEGSNCINGSPNSAEDGFQDARCALDGEEKNHPRRGVAQKSQAPPDKRISKERDESPRLQGGYEPVRAT